MLGMVMEGAKFGKIGVLRGEIGEVLAGWEKKSLFFISVIFSG